MGGPKTCFLYNRGSFSASMIMGGRVFKCIQFCVFFCYCSMDKLT